MVDNWFIQVSVHFANMSSIFSLDQLGVKWEKIMIEKLLNQMCPNEDFDCETKEVLERAAVDVFNTVLIKSCELVKSSRSDRKVLKGEDLLFFLRQNCDIDPSEFPFLNYYCLDHPSYHHSPRYRKTMMSVKFTEKQFLKRKGNVICKLPRSKKEKVKSTEVNKLTKNKVKDVTTYKVDKVNNKSKNRVRSVPKNMVKKVTKNAMNRMTTSKEISFQFHIDENFSEDKHSNIIRKSLSKKTANALTRANSCVSFLEKSQENFKKAEGFGNYSIMHKAELSNSQVSSSEISFHPASSSKENEFLTLGHQSSERQHPSSSLESTCDFIPEIKTPLKENEFMTYRGKPSKKLPSTSNSALNSISEAIIVSSGKGNKLSKNTVKVIKNEAEKVTKGKAKNKKKHKENKVVRNKEISFLFQNNLNYSEYKNSKKIIKSLAKKSADILSQDKPCLLFQEKSLENFKKAESFGSHSIIHKAGLSKCQVSSSDISFHLVSSSKENEFLTSGDQSSERQHPTSSLDSACNFIPEIKTPQTLKENGFIVYKDKPSKKLPSSSNTAFNSVSEAVIVSGAKGNKLSKNRVKKVVKKQAEKVTKDEAMEMKKNMVKKVVKNKEISFLGQNDGNYSEAKNSKMIINKNSENFRSHSIVPKAKHCKCQVSSSDISFHFASGSKENEFLPSGRHSSEGQHPSLSLDSTYNFFPETSRTLKEKESIMCKSKPAKKVPSCFSNSVFSSVSEAVIESSSKGNKINCKAQLSRRQYPIFVPCTTSSYESTPSRIPREFDVCEAQSYEEQHPNSSSGTVSDFCFKQMAVSNCKKNKSVVCEAQSSEMQHPRPSLDVKFKLDNEAEATISAKENAVDTHKWQHSCYSSDSISYFVSKPTTVSNYKENKSVICEAQSSTTECQTSSSSIPYTPVS